MSTLTNTRLRIQHTTDWPLYREQRAHLADLFAVIAYSGQTKRPLALGIRHDLFGANTGLSPDEVRHFLRAYTFGPKYLRALKVGNYRYALDGSRDGCVSNDEARHAGLCLKAHNAMRHLLRKRTDKIGLRAVEDALAVEPQYADDIQEAA